MINTVSISFGNYVHSFEVQYNLYPAEPSTDTPEHVEIERIFLAGSGAEIKAQLRAEDLRLQKIGMGRCAMIPMIEAKLLKGDVLQ